VRNVTLEVCKDTPKSNKKKRKKENVCTAYLRSVARVPDFFESIQLLAANSRIIVDNID